MKFWGVKAHVPMTTHSSQSPTIDPRRPARDVIVAVLDNMRRNLELLQYSTLAPSRYVVYLHAKEFARLEGIIPILKDQTARALTDELARLNRRANWQRYADQVLRRERPEVQNPAGEWQVEFCPDAEGELREGDILIDSELLIPSSVELGIGQRTRKVSTVHDGTRSRPSPSRPSEHQQPPAVSADAVGRSAVSSAGLQSREAHAEVATPIGDTPVTRRVEEPETGARSVDSASARSSAPPLPVLPPLPAPVPSPRVARLVYQDDRGEHTYEISKDLVTIGRGGANHAVDVKLVASVDVSREHARIRRDPQSGRYFLIDLSTLGTTINGRHVPRGFDDRDGTRRDNGAETALPDSARIGLAETVFLTFNLG